MNQLPPFVILIFAIASVTIAAGLLIWLASYIGRGRKQSSQERDQLPGGAPEESEAAVSSAGQELLRVSRIDGGLVIFVQGRRQQSLLEITDSQVGRDTVEAIQAVFAFSRDVLPSIRQQVGQTEDRQLAENGDATRSAVRDGAAPRAPTPPVTPPAPSSRRLLDPLPLTENIDELVQRRLGEVPDLAGRNIRLTTIGGGVRIYVDQDVYDAVDDIADPRVKALIQAAIREWESTH